MVKYPGILCCQIDHAPLDLKLNPFEVPFQTFFDKPLELGLKTNRCPLEVLKNDLTLEELLAQEKKLSNFLTQDELKEVVLRPEGIKFRNSNG